MERLTRRINGVVVYVGTKNPYSTGQIPCEVDSAGVREMMYRLAAYEDTGLTPDQCENAKVIIESVFSDDTSKAERIRELLKADRDGRLVVLLCRVGDTVWAILDGAKCASRCVVEYVTIGRCFTVVVFHTADRTREQYGVPAAAFGKTVFLTHEEAKKALEAMRKGETEHA